MTIQEPTLLQQTFIPPVLEGKDVLIRDTTGSGKTFGILLSLLSKPRRRILNNPGITSVIVVPNQELAHQLQSWTRTLFHSVSEQQFQEIIQVVVTPSLSIPLDNDDVHKRRHNARKGTSSKEGSIAGSNEARAQVDRLMRSLPHVLVATPTRLWSLIQSGILDLSGIETLVLDEVDHLIRLPKRFASQRQIHNRDMHPKPAELALREIIRSAQAVGRYPDNGEDGKRETNSNSTDRIQIVAASATMNRPIRHWLESNGWVHDPEWVDTTKTVVLPTGIQHHCLVVGAQSIRNMKPTSDAERWNKAKDGSNQDQEVDWAAADQDWKKEQMDKERDWKEQQLAAPEASQGLDTAVERFRDDDDRMLEGVATACMLDDVKSACVFFCSSFSLGDIAMRLEFDFGLKVKQIQSAFEGGEEHQAIVSNGRKTGIYLAHENNARGLDLPGLSHVYIVGLPSSPSSYLHMAGRTGRMGQKGQVVTIIRDDGHLEDRARSLFNRLSVPIEPFSHVE
ncbi:hypothetical protein BGX28_006614 [Mortierella sp. GBA30]|nr:hypothetical protein BGX28_006614 [Mortierella sp. GBA30]